MNLTITYHFEVGEKKPTIDKYHKIFNSNDDVSILVGDIGILNKLLIYSQGGMDSLAKDYLTRLQCSTSNCIRMQLPTNYERANEIIDENFYISILERLRKDEPKILVKMENGLRLDELSISIVRKILSDVIDTYYTVPLVNTLSTSKRSVVIVFEKNLRNIVSQRYKKSRSRNWIDKIPKQYTLSHDGSPLCKGILCAYFEKLSLLGYKDIQVILDNIYIHSFIKAWVLFDSSQHKIDYFQNIKLTFPKRVAFKTQQYE